MLLVVIDCSFICVFVRACLFVCPSPCLPDRLSVGLFFVCLSACLSVCLVGYELVCVCVFAYLAGCVIVCFVCVLGWLVGWLA